MKVGFALSIFILAMNCSIGQIEVINNHYIFKKDSTIIYVNNQPYHWFTIELNADTLTYLYDDNFFLDGVPLQILTGYCTTNDPEGIRGSHWDEVSILKFQQRYHEKEQEKKQNKKLDFKRDIFRNERDKPFILWWNETLIENDLTEVNEENNYQDIKYQLHLSFIVHAEIVITFRRPIYTNQTLEGEIEKFQEMANTLNVYGNEINLEVLEYRLKNDDKYRYQNAEQNIDITFPSWHNVMIVDSIRNIFIGSLPERKNVYNSLALIVSDTNDERSMKIYKEVRAEITGIVEAEKPVENTTWYRKRSKPKSKFTDRRPLTQRKNILNPKKYNNIKLKKDEDYIFRFKYTPKNVYFRHEDVYIVKDSMLYVIFFVATEKTYNYNIDKLDEFVEMVLQL